MDVVLNSLSGDSIEASFDVLAPGGRFLEIGLAGIWERERVREARPDAEYHVIYLGDVCVGEPTLIAELLDDHVRRFERGALARPPITAFDIRQTVAAFRYMAQARHIGKVVVTASVGQDLAAASATSSGTTRTSAPLPRSAAKAAACSSPGPRREHRTRRSAPASASSAATSRPSPPSPPVMIHVPPAAARSCPTEAVTTTLPM